MQPRLLQGLNLRKRQAISLDLANALLVNGDDLSDNKWWLELTGHTKALEPALQLFNRNGRGVEFCTMWKSPADEHFQRIVTTLYQMYAKLRQGPLMEKYVQYFANTRSFTLVVD
ncbi:hypothetical protein GH714_027571 [Hevea brasiliensis]|uniref:Uncharacterized protein n=1 Tax=Hevea brasiliensis TaxID=3981 RepID=A0A6A6N7J9_HEVBR|nr:hypothetical protein GH714_027571 [Hevea brasiliensis]